MEEEKRIYVHSVLGLWEIDFQGPIVDSDYNNPDYPRDDPGKFKPVASYHKDNLPLGASAFAYDSKLYLVGGERLDPNNIINKNVYVLTDLKSQLRPLASKTKTLSPCVGPKFCSLVVPVKTPTNTVFYVIDNNMPLFAGRGFNHGPGYPTFEVYDPSCDSWLVPEQPPYKSDHSLVTAAFELGGAVILRVFRSRNYYELSFDLASHTWKETFLFKPQMSYHPTTMIPVAGLSDKIRFGLQGGVVYAYKVIEVEGVGDRVYLQTINNMTEKNCCRAPLECWSSATISDIGDQEVLVVSSLRDSCSVDGRRVEFVHYYAFKFKVFEIEPSVAKCRLAKRRLAETGDYDDYAFYPGEYWEPFVGATFLDSVHRVVRMDDLEDMRLNYELLSAFTL